ncbi:hypothetical protein SAMN02910369_00265 [Lachnospiraceae bacterium NE2001]|jgi:hypothetical protein|nr:hypothetical protein SAMN02910369_00265 [Lachnospiraceae bacterium NE2001]
MKLKEKIGEAFRMYFILVTLITILLLVLGTLFDGDRTFSYEAFLSPLIYAAIGVIPVFFFNSDREVSVKGLVVQRIIQLLVVEASMLGIAFWSKGIATDRRAVVVGIAVGVALVFALSLIVEYLFELSISRKLNEDLERFQREEL